jgi:hypothetical protein
MFERYHKKYNISPNLESLRDREKVCWDMAKVFLENKDAHGIHDMGVEIQALQRAITELNKLL